MWGSDEGGRLPHSRADGQSPTELDAAQLRALAPVPSGAMAVAATAVVLLLIGWLLLYFLVYLPRGMVG
jgi:hypothetical protein